MMPYASREEITSAMQKTINGNTKEDFLDKYAVSSIIAFAV